MATRHSAQRPRPQGLEYERQKQALLKPVQTWERQWVAPRGDDGTGTAKVLKWVKSSSKQTFESEDEPSEDEAMTPLDTPTPPAVSSVATPAPGEEADANEASHDTSAVHTPTAVLPPTTILTNASAQKVPTAAEADSVPQTIPVDSNVTSATDSPAVPAPPHAAREPSPSPQGNPQVAMQLDPSSDQPGGMAGAEHEEKAIVEEHAQAGHVEQKDKPGDEGPGGDPEKAAAQVIEGNMAG